MGILYMCVLYVCVVCVHVCMCIGASCVNGMTYHVTFDLVRWLTSRTCKYLVGRCGSVVDFAARDRRFEYPARLNLL